MYWKQWLQTLLGLVILLCVLEMLLPSGELAKFSKLVIGLAVMLAVLQPLSILLNQDIQVADFAWDTTSTWEPNVQRLADKVQLAATTPFLRNNMESVTSQLEDVLLNQDHVERVSVQILQDGSDLVVRVWVEPLTPTHAETISEMVSSILNIPANKVLVVQGVE